MPENSWESYEELVKEILTCTKCRLHKTRRRAVPGEGKLGAKLMIIGEAPGEREDEEGRPFVGQAGQLLNKLLVSVGISREDAYITNVVKCRPPNNRDPERDEVEACRPYLLAQINMVRPRVILCLGRHSARELLKMAGYPEGKVSSIGSVRGRAYRVKIGNVEATVVPTYHPASALYNPRNRAIIEEDLRLVKRLLGDDGGLLNYL